MKPTLPELKNQGIIWQASQQAELPSPYVSSGYSRLDKKLQGGWPKEGLVEVRPSHMGIGELRLILPCLELLAKDARLQVWLNPPARLTPYSLPEAKPGNTLVITPPKQNEACWVAEQLLRSGCCSSLVFWSASLHTTQAKRLQLAAKEGKTLGFIISADQPHSASLPLSMRINLSARPRGLNLNIFKRQHAWPIEPFDLDLSERWPQLFKHAPRYKEGATHSGHPPENSHDNIVTFPLRQP